MRSSLVRSLVASALLCGASTQLQAQDETVAGEEAATEALPSGEGLFEKHIEAIGGRELFWSQRSRVVTGRVRASIAGGTPMQGRLKIWREAPNKYHQVLTIPGQGTITTSFDGTSVWSQPIDLPPRLLEGQAADSVRDNAYFHGECDYKQKYSLIESLGRSTFEETDVHEVRVTGASGTSRIIVFSVETDLIIAIREPADEAGVPDKRVTTIAEYQEFDGILHPTLLVLRDRIAGGMETEIMLRQITTDVGELPDFGPPQGTESASESGG